MVTREAASRLFPAAAWMCQSRYDMKEHKSKKSGCGCCGGGVFGSIGAVLAAVLSWKVNHSIGWALVHAFFSWFYVVYHWLEHGELLP